MDSRFGGVIALLLTGGGLYWAATSLGPFFAERNEALRAGLDQMVEEVADTASDAADAVGDAVSEAAEEAGELVEDAAQMVEETAETVLDDASDMVEEVMSDDDDTPVLDVVRIEPTGNTLIAGNAPEGEQVGLLYNDELIAQSQVEPGGDFVLTPDQPLPRGEGTLEIITLDEDGQTLARSAEQVAVVLPEGANEAGFLVGVLRPGEPVEIIERAAPTQDVAAAADDASAPAEEVAQEVAQTEAEPEAEPVEEAFIAVDAIELEGQRIWIAGAALPGTIVRLYQDNALLGEAVAGPEGRFLYEGDLTGATGNVMIRADALTQGSGEVLARAQVPFAMPVVAQAEPEATQPEVTESEVATATPPAATPEATQSERADVTPVQPAEPVEPAEPAEPATPAAPASDDDSASEETALEEASMEEATEEETMPVEIASANERVSVLDTGQIIIRRGDNLWRLSRRVFGQGIRYTSIYDANRDQIQDPALIFPGQVFDVPQADRDWGEVPGLEALEPDQVIRSEQ